MVMNSVNMNIRVERTLINSLKILALEKGVSMSYIVKLLIMRELSNYE